MEVKLTSREASEAQKRIATRVCGLRPDEAEWAWTNMHDATDDEPGRLVREMIGAAQRLAIAGVDNTRAYRQYMAAHAAALANPIARAFLEGE